MEFQEREGVVAMGGKQLTLLGPEAVVGRPAPDFRVVDAALEPVRLSDFEGKVRLISAVPSIDTGVCVMQTKRFNDELEHPDTLNGLFVGSAPHIGYCWFAFGRGGVDHETPVILRAYYQCWDPACPTTTVWRGHYCAAVPLSPVPPS